MFYNGSSPIFGFRTRRLTVDNNYSTINNVWWADVCEDAITFKQGSGTSYINGGGAFKADDKIIQFNGRGTVQVKNFFASDYGKVARSCGNCSGNGGPRNFISE